MAGKSKIEWCTDTWNPVVGCSIVSPGCTNCYAMGMAARIQRMTPGSHYAGTTQASKAGPVWTGKMVLAPDQILTAPLRWRRPRRIFVNSMGDLFHDDVPDAWIDHVFAVMALAPQHTFQVLTKRSARMRDYLGTRAGDWMLHWPDAARKAGALLGDMQAIKELRLPLPNVWLGVSAEDQRRADERVPDLLATPAAVRFVSAEPLLGPIDFTNLDNTGDCRREKRNGISALWKTTVRSRLDWIIVGGESGPRARPMHPQWARDICDQCAAAGVAFHFKQNGEFRPVAPIHGGEDDEHTAAIINADERRSLIICGDGRIWPDDAGQPPDDAWLVERVGKARAGRLLDGIEHNGMPEFPHA